MPKKEPILLWHDRFTWIACCLHLVEIISTCIPLVLLPKSCEMSGGIQECRSFCLPNRLTFYHRFLTLICKMWYLNIKILGLIIIYKLGCFMANRVIRLGLYDHLSTPKQIVAAQMTTLSTRSWLAHPPSRPFCRRGCLISLQRMQLLHSRPYWSNLKQDL